MKFPAEAPRQVMEAADWFARLQDEPLSDAEQSEYETWLASDPENRIAIAELGALWECSGSATQDQTELELPAQRAELSGAVENVSPWWSRRKLGALAMAASLALAAALYLLMPGPPESHSTAIGQQQIVYLEDGSRVHLNTDSVVEVSYESDVRLLHLVKGEAVFDVTHDPDRPFEVEAGAGRAQALGTIFSVRARETGVVITVLEGRVKVSSNRVGIPDAESGTEGTVLQARQQITYSEAGLISEVTETDLRGIQAWQTGKLDLDDLSLAEVVMEMNRYTTRKLVIADDRLNALRISGVFRIGDVDGLVAALTSAFPVRAHQRDNAVLLQYQSAEG